MARGEELTGAPRVLTMDGLTDRLWDSWEDVAAWCLHRDLPAPLDAYRGHRLALRDHAAYWWAAVEHPHPRFKSRPADGVWERYGVPGPGRARMQARMKALGIPGAWSYSDILDN